MCAIKYSFIDSRLKLGIVCLISQTQQDAEGDGLNPEPCPICQRELGAEVMLTVHHVARGRGNVNCTSRSSGPR